MPLSTTAKLKHSMFFITIIRHNYLLRAICVIYTRYFINGLTLTQLTFKKVNTMLLALKYRARKMLALLR